MTSAFRQLQRLVYGGEVSVVHIDAVPRSMSTALEIACAQMADAQVNEPFNRGRCDLDAAAMDVMNAIPRNDTKEPPMIVTKAIASEIDPHFTDWLTISSRVILAVRNPLIQMASLLERIGNDVINGRGTSEMSFVDLVSFAPQVDSAASAVGFRRAAWRELFKHYHVCHA